MFWFAWQRRIVRSLCTLLGDWCMPWWKRTAMPESMTRPDARTEKVIDRLEVVAERMEAVAKVLADEMDANDSEQYELQRLVREAQGRPRRGARTNRSDDSESGRSDGGDGE